MQTFRIKATGLFWGGGVVLPSEYVRTVAMVTHTPSSHGDEDHVRSKMGKEKAGDGRVVPLIISVMTFFFKDSFILKQETLKLPETAHLFTQAPQSTTASEQRTASAFQEAGEPGLSLLLAPPSLLTS